MLDQDWQISSRGWYDVTNTSRGGSLNWDMALYIPRLRFVCLDSTLGFDYFSLTSFRGRLLLWTPGPVPFGTCICSNVETILSWTCHVYGPFKSRTSLGTSILLIYAFQKEICHTCFFLTSRKPSDLAGKVVALHFDVLWMTKLTL